MKRYYYSENIENFLQSSDNEILGNLSRNSHFRDDVEQKNAWIEEIRILNNVLKNYFGTIYFEYSIPRMGRRIDVVLIIKNVIFVLEFKIGEKTFYNMDIDQVWDYALDLKNFHETSHKHLIAPILLCTNAKEFQNVISTTHHNDNLLFPIKSNAKVLKGIIDEILLFADGDDIVSEDWSNGRYYPTPTIIEAAMSLYNSHTVEEIARSDADAENLSLTSNSISSIISATKSRNEKAICFVTGVPGAGKTLVGLNIATKELSEKNDNRSVFLSGNGPLVKVLREALTRDKVRREKEKGLRIKKGDVLSEVKLFIQNVHNYRDEYLVDSKPPFDHIAIFDEAQRAWNKEQTCLFMRLKKKKPDFNQSEPDFLISCLDRHEDWAVIICLVGGGQEINKGEAGISEWIVAINDSFPNWKVYISDKLKDSEYAAGNALEMLQVHNNISIKPELHLAVSMRSFRAENLSAFVKNLLDLDVDEARKYYVELRGKYPIVITRDVYKAKRWLRKMARGSERYGMVVSSQAYRLKPECIDVRVDINPVLWFLNGKDDVRSSYYLEDVATEFDIQGLELDWACITWDADLRITKDGWDYNEFKGTKWRKIKKEERKQFLKNAYRVLLTRARQGMVIVVPPGNKEDHTRNPKHYDDIYEYLKSLGINQI